MASAQIYSSINMLDASVWYGTVVAATASVIQIVGGRNQTNYYGNFSYDGTGRVYGTLTGTTEIENGKIVATTTGLSVDATFAQYYIQSNNLQPFFQAAAAGDDQFYINSIGTHIINGYGGYNTVYEQGTYSSYTFQWPGAFLINGGGESDTLYGISGVYFKDGFYDLRSGMFSPSTPSVGFAAQDMTAGHQITSAPIVYSGPVAGLQKEFISVSSDNLNVSVSSANWFIHTGSGDDAINVSGGTNVLDGGTGSNFLVGGNGLDTFYVDDRNATTDIWSTVVGFHSGDATTLWGVTANDFNLAWIDGQGATGYIGLTLHASAANKPNASLTLTGYSQADLTNGRISVSFGNVVGNNYMYVHGN